MLNDEKKLTDSDLERLSGGFQAIPPIFHRPANLVGVHGDFNSDE